MGMTKEKAMGMTPRQFTGILVIVSMFTIVGIIASGMLTREMLPSAYAEEGAPAKMARLVWKVETFVENDNSRVAERLSGKLEDHLNNVAKMATDVKLLLSYKTSGNVMATLVYCLDDTPHHYKVHLHKCLTTSDDHRVAMKAKMEGLLNTPGARLHCLAQDAKFDQVLVGAVCEMK